MTEQISKAPRLRLGPLALELSEVEAAGEPVTFLHLEMAIARLQGQVSANQDIAPTLKLINENILRLCSILIAEALVEDGEVLEAMKELQASIARDTLATTKDTPIHDPELGQLREELDKQVMLHRAELVNGKDKQIDERER